MHTKKKSRKRVLGHTHTTMGCCTARDEERGRTLLHNEERDSIATRTTGTGGHCEVGGVRAPSDPFFLAIDDVVRALSVQDRRAGHSSHVTAVCGLTDAECHTLLGSHNISHVLLFQEGAPGLEQRR